MRQVMVVVLTLVMAAEAEARLVKQTVAYRAGDAVLEGYLVYDDATTGRRPGVLVSPEWWGLTSYTKNRADQLARRGYIAFALDMYGKGATTENPKQASDWSGHLKSSPLLRERARAGYKVLAEHHLTDGDQLAAIGFCFGGTTVLELAYSGADLAGVASLHGGLPAPAPAEYGRIRSKFLILQGAEDPFISTGEIEHFQEAMHQANADWQMILYGGAKHGFTNPRADQYGLEGVAYNALAAKRSWEHLQLFLQEIFPGPASKAAEK